MTRKLRVNKGIMANGGKPRIILTGEYLEQHGWAAGVEFVVTIENEKIIIERMEK